MLVKISAENFNNNPLLWILLYFEYAFRNTDILALIFLLKSLLLLRVFKVVIEFFL